MNTGKKNHISIWLTILIVVGLYPWGIWGSAFAASLPDPAGEWEHITVSTVRDAAPTAFSGQSVEIMPLRYLSVMPASNFFQSVIFFKKNGLKSEPRAIVVAKGTYDLAGLTALINDERILKREGKSTYTAFLPIFVTSSACLVIRDATLRLSLQDYAFLIYRGDLFIVDAEVTTWDVRQGNYGPRPKIPKEELLLYNQMPRPYLLGLYGSRTYFANSAFKGLGFQGRTSTFGLSVFGGNLVFDDESYNSPGRPTGIMVGNTVSQTFFGFYPSLSGAMAIIGNLFENNVIYNLDPHDYAKGLKICRNICTGAGYKHGIVLSRGVRNSLVAENILISNGGSGFMLDRACHDNTVRNNLIFANQGDGISIFESYDNIITGNLVFTNGHDGLLIRNSRGIEVTNNTIYRNGYSGIEINTGEVDTFEPRDMLRDFYEMKTKVQVVENKLHKNLYGAVSIKGDDVRVFIKDNDFTDSGSKYFQGDIEKHQAEIIEANQGDGYWVRFQALPDRRADASMARVRGSIDEQRAAIFIRLAKEGVLGAYDRLVDLARMHPNLTALGGKSPIEFRIMAAAAGDRESIRFIAAELIGNRDPRYMDEALRLMAVEVILSRGKTAMKMKLLPKMIAVSDGQIVDAFQKALARVAESRIIDFKALPVEMSPTILDGIRLDPRHAAYARSLIQGEQIANAESIFRIFGREMKNWSAFSLSQQSRFFDKQQDRNHVKKTAILLKKKAAQQEKAAQGEEKAYLERQKQREIASQNHLAANVDEDLEHYRREVESALEKINHHRAPENRINIQWFLKKLKGSQD